MDKLIDALLGKEDGDLVVHVHELGVPTAQPEPCEDAISRKDAIDALENMSANYTGHGDREWHPHMDFVVEILEKLPSVTPKLNLVNKIDGLLEEYRKSQLSVTQKTKDMYHGTCLECSHSMSADDEWGNPILVCSEQNYKAVEEEDTCWDWTR